MCCQRLLEHPGSSPPGHVAEAGQTLPGTPCRQRPAAVCRSVGDPVLPRTRVGSRDSHPPGFHSEAASGEATGAALPLSRCEREPCCIFAGTHHLKGRSLRQGAWWLWFVRTILISCQTLFALYKCIWHLRSASPTVLKDSHLFYTHSQSYTDPQGSGDPLFRGGGGVEGEKKQTSPLCFTKNLTVEESGFSLERFSNCRSPKKNNSSLRGVCILHFF